MSESHQCTGLCAKPCQEHGFAQPLSLEAEHNNLEFMSQLELEKPSSELDTAMQTFVAQYWDSQPVVYRFPESALPNAQDLFQALVRSAARTDGKDSGAAIFLDRVKLTDTQGFLPQASDGHLEGYLDRIVGTPPKQEMMYHQVGLQVHDQQLWDKAKNFVAASARVVGLPIAGVDLDTFLGKYRSTPRGIHTDPCQNFMLVVAGHKKMLVWHPEYFENKNLKIVGTPQHRTVMDCDYREHLDAAIVLEGGPGEVIYWPPSYWHIGAAADQYEDLTAVVNINLHLGQTKAFMLSDILEKATNAVIGNKKVQFAYPETSDLSGEIKQIPQLEQDMLDQLRRILNNPAVDESLLERWLRHLSGQGFKGVLPLADTHECPVSGNVSRSATLYWSCCRDQILVSANGHLRRFLAKPELLEVLELINANGAVSMQQVHDLVAPELAQDLLGYLIKARAISVA
jgi:50S ribosomal protein L16 3-hydroxylase